MEAKPRFVRLAAGMEVMRFMCDKVHFGSRTMHVSVSIVEDRNAPIKPLCTNQTPSIDRLHIRFGRTIDSLTIGGKATAVYWTIPGLFRRVPVQNASLVRTNRIETMLTPVVVDAVGDMFPVERTCHSLSRRHFPSVDWIGGE